MFGYGKMASYAISSLSYLAASYETEGFRANSATIALARNLSKPLVGKLMSQMSTAGLVNGTPGPGGGFYLAKKPSEISLMDIVKLFEKVEDALSCPFGPGWCGEGDPCPIHFELAEKNEEMIEWLSETKLNVFLEHSIKPNRGSPDCEGFPKACDS
tara:strand:+ start:563 stop:1033 length:471 start_codon:yes stop_codon:yes gene_type:complete